MADTVGDVLLARLRDWGVREVFAYPGDGINGLVTAFGRADDDPAFVQVRHEEMAALAAVGHAKFSGGVGVCAATSGPGAIHLLNGLYDAKLDHVPVVAIVGQTARSAMGGAYQQEVDLHTLFADVAGAYLVEVDVPEQLPNAVDRAFRTALTRRAPTAIIVPSDVQELTYSAPEHEFKHVPAGGTTVLRAPAAVPPDDELDRAAELLDAGEKVAILVGQGARGAAAEVTAVAEVLGAGVAKALLGKDVLPDDLPWVTGAIGLLGTRASYELMRDCDTLLMIGTGFPYSQFLPEYKDGTPTARAVQIDLDGGVVGMRYPTEVNLVGDAATTLRALLPRLSGPADRAWRETVESNVASWWRTVESQSMLDAKPVNPMRIVQELSQRLPADAIVAADSGSVANWYARLLKVHGDVRCSLSGTLATMGAAVPYAIGAKFAHPDRPAIALVGDGAMQMNNLAELLTIARYAPRWADPRLIVCVLHNNDLTQVSWELRAMGGAPRFDASQALPDVSYADFAAGIGLHAVTVDDPDALGPAWDAALAADRPSLIDVHCDPDVPPIPPHATPEQAVSVLQAVLKGDPDAGHLVAQGIRTKLRELLPRNG
ncbi:thiamine pyrophosphate-requiring protein [Pseudonocardia sp.]|uniref:thiamine pyrophosphate-requiring protein n=1 Tax=Pseudonocardia sp. TaxID=60912 RepID=UPI003D139891